MDKELKLGMLVIGENETYRQEGRIDCIYIDPPYNTGNDFIYKVDYLLTK